MTAVSLRAYARHRGVHPSTVEEWKKNGRILVLPDGKLDQEQSDIMLDTRPDVYRGGVKGGTPAGWSGGAGGGGGTTSKAIEMKETYLALNAKLKYERAAARLCEIDAVKDAIAADYAIVRNLLMGIGSKVAPLVAVCRNAEECKNIIDGEIIKALAELTEDDAFDDIKRGIEQPSDDTPDNDGAPVPPEA